MHRSLSSGLMRFALVASLAGVVTAFGALRMDAAQAQVLELSVNGDPITSIDIEERMKLLRAIHRPAGRDAAIESMIETRLKAHEGQSYGIAISDNEIGSQVQTDAKKLKTTPQALLAAIQRAGVSDAHLKTYFKAELAFSVFVKALNRGVEASEVAVRAELAKEKGKGGVEMFSLRQVVFTLNPGESPEGSVKQAEALRSRFTSCATGIPYAKSLPGVAVREPLTRSSTDLPDSIKEVLDKTPVGHLTGPSRSANGIELIAVCDKNSSGDDEALRRNISDRILSDHLAQAEVAKYKELRARAIIQRAR